MKTLRLLNKYFFLITFTLVFSLTLYAEDEPVDIWKIDKKNEQDSFSSVESVEENQDKILLDLQ